jgi:hypothetical protein
MMIDIRASYIDDADHIRVRADDCREIWRTSLSDPNKAIRRAILSSRDAWTVFVDDEIMCIFGVATSSMINRVGTPWLLGSDLIVEHKYEFLAGSKKYIDLMKHGYSKLVNHVDQDNELSILWLQWLGFDVETEAKPYGAIGKPFRKFTMEDLHV